MPFRLLGIFPRLEDASLLCGGTLAGCADAGIETMVVSLTGCDGPGDGLSRAARLLGIGHLVRLDFAEAGLDGADAQSIRLAIADLVQSFQPDVVILSGDSQAAADWGRQPAPSLGVAAFMQARQGGTDIKPARLYSPTGAQDPTCTTVVDIRSHARRKLAAINAHTAQPAFLEGSADHGTELLDREFYVRLQPRPWVTGIIERDLFGGLAERSASAARSAAA